MFFHSVTSILLAVFFDTNTIKSPTGPRLLLDSTALHCSAGCQANPAISRAMVLSSPNGMSFPHSVGTSGSVHRPNQVSDWTSTLARLDCTALLCWMPAHPYYYEIVLGVGKDECGAKTYLG